MPGFDGMGPYGNGPMTGRGLGYCVVKINDTRGELAYLRDRAVELQKQLERLEIRIKELERE